MSSDKPVSEYFQRVEVEIENEGKSLGQQRPKLYEGIETALNLCNQCLSPLGGKRAGDSQHVMDLNQASMPSWSDHITELKELDSKKDLEKYNLLKEKYTQLSEELDSIYPSKFDSNRLLSEEIHKIVDNLREPIKELNPSDRDSGFVTGFVYVVECHIVALHKMFQDKRYQEEIGKSHF